MTTAEYLKSLLDTQDVAAGSDEMKALDEHQATVERIIAEAFPDSTPTIKPGGSRAKKTMIRDSYDLDLICYFPHEDTEPGESLEKIYKSVKDALAKEYYVEEKRSALRLKGKRTADLKRDFHVDVVPGRYIDEDKSDDVYLHQTAGDHDYLKTNLAVHIDHIRKSGVRDAIRVMKLWNVQKFVGVKTFVLELAVVKLLKDKKDKRLEDQLLHVWTYFRDSSDELSVEDPANSGNDLKPLVDSVRPLLSSVSASTLCTIEALGWELLFGKVPEKASAATIVAAAAAVSTPTRPWSPGV